MALSTHAVDDFIADLPVFAQMICLKLDALMHQAEPLLTEGKKWGSLSYGIEQGLVCGFYVTKAGVTLTFYDGALLQDASQLLKGEDARARRSILFSSVEDVESNTEALMRLVREAVQNKEKGLKAQTATHPVDAPADFSAALQSAGLIDSFERLSPSARKEYEVWIEGTKKAETRQRRIEKALAQIAQGQTLYGKYRS